MNASTLTDFSHTGANDKGLFEDIDNIVVVPRRQMKWMFSVFLNFEWMS